ncbi:hypothetical protein KSP39_PZI022502 [Platanthera zijinensis]|uniref:Uncharacterized protein n=1 Tax=Platanthera zijinensis TaxID=2320716 RepID=A0AAP0AVM2_9ASPA
MASLSSSPAPISPAYPSVGRLSDSPCFPQYTASLNWRGGSGDGMRERRCMAGGVEFWSSADGGCFSHASLEHYGRSSAIGYEEGSTGKVVRTSWKLSC